MRNVDNSLKYSKNPAESFRIDLGETWQKQEF